MAENLTTVVCLKKRCDGYDKPTQKQPVALIVLTFLFQTSHVVRPVWQTHTANDASTYTNMHLCGNVYFVYKTQIAHDAKKQDS